MERFENAETELSILDCIVCIDLSIAIGMVANKSAI